MMETETFTSDGVVADTRRGLLDDPKWLSSLYFYDVRGSELFEAICETPEYYPTRTERALLAAHADEILATAAEDDPEGRDGTRDPVPLTLAELGSGSSAKTRVLLQALLARQGAADYLPVDVSADFLRGVAADLEDEFSGLHVHPLAEEYGAGLQRIGAWPATRRLVLFLGSSIGNFEPEEQVGLLRVAHDALSPGDAFLLGTDMVKDPAVLEAAYNDAADVTAAFNKNILQNLDRQLDGDADPDRFDHVAVWDAERERIQMFLESRTAQVLRFKRADLEVPLSAGERIHTENSYKFTPESARIAARAAGFELERSWSDDQGWFCLHLLRKAP